MEGGRAKFGEGDQNANFLLAVFSIEQVTCSFSSNSCLPILQNTYLNNVLHKDVYFHQDKVSNLIGTQVI